MTKGVRELTTYNHTLLEETHSRINGQDVLPTPIHRGGDRTLTGPMTITVPGHQTKSLTAGVSVWSTEQGVSQKRNVKCFIFSVGPSAGHLRTVPAGVIRVNGSQGPRDGIEIFNSFYKDFG